MIHAVRCMVGCMVGCTVRGRAVDGVPGGDARQLVRRERRPLHDVLHERRACDAVSGERDVRAVVGAGQVA